LLSELSELPDCSCGRKQWIVRQPSLSQAGGKVKLERLATQGVQGPETGNLLTPLKAISKFLQFLYAQ
jgi:hypothetical protein